MYGYGGLEGLSCEKSMRGGMELRILLKLILLKSVPKKGTADNKLVITVAKSLIYLF